MKRERAAYYKEYAEKNKDKIANRRKVTSKAYREENREHLLQKSKEYYENNKDKVLARMANQRYDKYHYDPKNALSKQQDWKRDNVEKYLVQSARARSKKYGIPCTITYKDVIVPEKCPYLEVELVPFSGWTSPSLDKIVPELGYVAGNIQVISTLANTMKNQASIEQLLTFSRAVLRMHSLKQKDKDE